MGPKRRQRQDASVQPQTLPHALQSQIFAFGALTIEHPLRKEDFVFMRGCRGDAILYDGWLTPCQDYR